MSKARDLANAGTALTTVSATELGYLDGVTSAVQTQIDSKIGQSTAINPSTVTTKGDILVATGSGTIVRQGVGTNGQLLSANSAQADGVEWVDAPSSGSMTSIASGTLGSSGTTISSISGSYKDLRLVLRGVLSGDSIGIRLNGDTSSNYRVAIMETGATSIQGGAQTTSYNTWVNSTVIAIGINVFLYDYTNTSNKKHIMHGSVRDNTAVWGEGFYGAATAAITSITMFPISSTITAGTYELFGVK